MQNYQISNPELRAPPPTIRALVLDDNDFDRTRIRRFAEKSELPVIIDEVPSISAMRDAMARDAYDLFLVDYSLPEGNGLGAVDIIHENALNKDAAVIMVTGQQQQQIAVSAFRHGCHDLITKDELSPMLLRERMTDALERVRMPVMRDLFEEERLQRHLQMALRHSMESETMKSIIADGLERAVRVSGGRTDFSEQKNVEAFLLDFLNYNEFQFKH